MAQKNKILLVNTEEIIDKNGLKRKIFHRYVIKKSKGTGKTNINKLALKKYNPILRKHVIYKETKYK